jgi:hypothetical protein
LFFFLLVEGTGENHWSALIGTDCIYDIWLENQLAHDHDHDDPFLFRNTCIWNTILMKTVIFILL